MKKLLAMIGAVAMSFGLFADATPFSISFEAAESAKGVSEGVFNPNAESVTGWSWAGDPLSLAQYVDEVLPYGSGDMARRDNEFTGLADNDNYLPLETGTDELVRDVGEDNLYLDQLVKFTGFEDPQTNLTGNTKIAIWMSEFENEDESTTTNLYVTVGKVTGAGVEQIALAVNTNVNYKLDTWYRLTVKALEGGIYTSAVSDSQRAGFLVWINGQPAVTDDEAAKSLTPFSGEMTATASKFMAKGRLFTAIDATDATFASVGYQGIGAIDDIILDDVGPAFTVETVDVGFTTIEGAIIATVTDAEGVVEANEDGTYSVKPGALTVTLAAAPGYKLFGTLTYDASTDDAVEGMIDIAADETTAEQVVATLTLAGAVGWTDLAASELADAFAELGEGDVINTLAACTVTEGEVGEEKTLYSFTPNTAITGTATGLNIYVGNYEIEEVPTAGGFDSYADIMLDETLIVTFEDADNGMFTYYGEAVNGQLVCANGMMSTVSAITVGEDGFIKAAMLVPSAVITLTAVGAQVAVLDDNTLIDSGYIVAGEELEAKVSEEPDEDGYYTYTAQAFVPPASGFIILIGGEPQGEPYDTLAEAVAAAPTGATIKFLEGAELDSSIVIADKAVTFDLNGQTVIVSNTALEAPFIVKHGASLTIDDLSDGKTGAIDASNVMCAVKMTENKFDVCTDGSAHAVLIVNAGTLTGLNYAIAGNGNPGRGYTDITINGGTIVATDAGVNSLEKCSCAIYNSMEYSTLTINGGTIVGYDSAVEIRAGALTVTGGTLTAKNETYSVKGNGNGPTVTGAALAVSQHTTKKELGATVSAISGATLTGTKAVAVVNPQLNTTDNVEVELGQATYNGGLAFEADGNAEVTDNNSGLAAPAGYFWDGGVLAKCAAEINGTYYNTLAAAFTAAETGDEIVLLKDVELDACIDVAKAVTLDIGDYSITPKADALATNKKFATGTTKDALFVLHYGADFTVNGDAGVIDTEGNLYAAIKLTEKGDQYVDTTAKLTVNANLTGTYYAITGSGNAGRGGTEIVINGGLIKGTAENDCAGIYHPQAGTLTINGGTIEGATGIYAKAGDCKVSVSSGATIKGVGAKADYRPCTDGFYPTGDAIVFDSCNYPGGEPEADIAGGTFESTYAAAVASYATAGEEAIAGFVTGGSFKGQVAPDPALAGGSMAFPTFVPGEAQTLVEADASVNGVNYETAAQALAAVQALEAAGNFPIVAQALVADLAVVDPVSGATISLAKDETITINANSWVFSGGATISDGPIALAAGATFKVYGKLDKSLFLPPTDYEVTETDAGDGWWIYSAAQSAAKVAKIGNVEYPTLADAVAALEGTGDETIELLCNYTVAVDEVIAFAKDVTLDLGSFTLTMPTAALSGKQFKVEADTEVTLTNGTIAQEEGGNRGLQVYGTVNVDCTMTKVGTAAPVFDLFDGAVVNAGENADITADAMIFWSKKTGTRTLNITGGKYHSGAATGASDDYAVVYNSYSKSSGEYGTITVNITDGEFTSKDGALAGWDDNIICELDDTCKAKFNNNKRLADYIKAGYEAVKGEDDWYTIQKSPVAEIVGGGKYGTLGEAIAALTGGETIKLLSDYTATDAEANNLQFKASATLDLNEKTLTVPGTVMSTQKFGTAADTEVTFTNGTILMPEDGGNRGITIYGTLNVACTIVRNGDAAPVFDVMDGATLNAGDDADITSDAIIFWVKKTGDRTINITGGEYKGSHNTTGTDYDVFYASYADGYAELNITGGEFTGKNGIIAALYDGLIDCSLDDTCGAKFSKVGVKTEAFHDVAGYIADGYEAVKGDDDWYTIQAIPSYTVAAITVENAKVEATNKTAKTVLSLPATVLRDTEIAVTVTPDTGYEYATTPAGWTKNDNGSITTNATVTADLAITVEAPTAAAAPWPVDPDFPADADEEVKAKYADWAKTYGVTDPAGTSDAFLMNADPKGTIPALEITSIEVADGVATIKVAAGEKNLKEGINGKLFVSATDDLAGEWVTTEVETPKSFEDDGLTAVFEVEGAQFMKAKVGFKVEVPADK